MTRNHLKNRAARMVEDLRDNGYQGLTDIVRMAQAWCAVREIEGRDMEYFIRQALRAAVGK